MEGKMLKNKIDGGRKNDNASKKIDNSSLMR
jgi:hypothetical protein